MATSFPTMQGHQTTPQFFEQQYSCCSSFSAHENGNRIIMPASALDRLASLKIEYPMVFSIQDAWTDDRVSHCGVLEFGAEEGFVLMPNWMISNLGTVEGQLVTLKSTSLPKGTYMKIQPHSTKFIQGLSNPKEILEGILRDFSCITAGDTIAISYRGESYKIDILETKPSNAISLIETDCEVDFAQPLDYKEPPPLPPPQAQPTKTCCPKQVHDEANTKLSFTPFMGFARRLDGRASQPVSTSIASNDGPVTSTNPESSSSRKGAGNMVFGHKENNTKEAIPITKSQVAESIGDTKLFKPFTGAGRSLQGQKRNGMRGSQTLEETEICFGELRV